MDDLQRHPATAAGEADRAPASRLRTGLALWLLVACAQVALAFAQRDSSQPDAGDPPIFYEWTLGASSLVFAAFLVAITLGIAGLDPLGRATAAGLVGFPPRAMRAAIGTVALALVVGALLEPFLRAGEEQGLAPQSWDPSRAGQLIFNAIVICTAVPLAEELFFRGLGVRMLGVVGYLPSIVGTGLLFGLAHGIPEALPPLVIFGVGLAWVRARTGSVWPGVIAHGAYNALGIAISLAL